MADPVPRRILRLQPRLLPLDLAVLGLALASFLLVVADVTVRPGPDEEAWLRSVDYAAILVFGLLLVGKAFASGAPVRYVRHHWFDILGLLPVTQPLLGLDRWWTFIGVLIVLARASAALDRAFGERVLHLVFARYRSMLAEELTEPILLRLLQKLRDAVAAGSLMEAMGRRLEARRPDVHAIVRRSIEASPKLTFVAKLPGADAKVRETVDEAVTSAVVALASAEMNALVRDALAEAIRDLERAVERPSWKQEGYSLGDIVRGLVRTEG